ncbi:MAG: hypothetical protein ACYTXT_37600 [Nostoc sp.]
MSNYSNEPAESPSSELKPDYEAMRDRVGASVSAEALRRTALSTFNKLKMGRQSTAGKAIEAFIKELNG